MANVVCIWERGAALGHLASLKPFLEKAVRDGHDVTLISREIQNVSTVLGKIPIRLLQTPVVVFPSKKENPHTLSVSMLLGGFYRSKDVLSILCKAWDDLFDILKPDLVIYDYAPTALIASLGRKWVKWTVGSGFLVPRTDENPFGVMEDAKPLNIAKHETITRSDENLLLDINAVLLDRNRSGISSITNIWDQVDRCWLLTLPELDHFGVRPNVDYLGVPSLDVGKVFAWPDKQGLKILGYLSSCEALIPLLDALNSMSVNGVFYSRDFTLQQQQKYTNLTLSNDPLSLPALLQDASLMINMGSHKTVLQAWLSGVPQLMLASQQEQLILARKVSAQRRGVAALAANKNIEKALNASLKLAVSGKFLSDLNLCNEMLGNKLNREIEFEFKKLRLK